MPDIEVVVFKHDNRQKSEDNLSSSRMHMTMRMIYDS